jgi:hypothetical protein
MSFGRYRQTEVNREYWDNALKCLETRWRVHPVLPSSMQAKEKMYVHISVGRLGVDMEFEGDERWVEIPKQPPSHGHIS